MAIDITQYHLAETDELIKVNRYICDLIKARHTAKLANAASHLYPGQRVYFIANNSGYRGQKIIGIIDKVNRLRVKLTSTTGMKWTVDASMLKPEPTTPVAAPAITLAP